MNIEKNICYGHFGMRKDTKGLKSGEWVNCMIHLNMNTMKMDN